METCVRGKDWCNFDEILIKNKKYREGEDINEIRRKKILVDPMTFSFYQLSSSIISLSLSALGFLSLNGILIFNFFEQ